jgi:hypothetical protein
MKVAGFFRESVMTGQSGPSIRDSVAQSPMPDQARAAEYLRNGTSFASFTAIEPDPIDPSQPATEGVSLLTDGAWVWPSTLAVYVERHNVRVPVEFINHMRSRQWSPRQLSEARVSAIGDEIANRSSPSRDVS